MNHINYEYFQKYCGIFKNNTLTENGLHYKNDPNSLWLFFIDDFTVA